MSGDIAPQCLEYRKKEITGIWRIPGFVALQTARLLARSGTWRQRHEGIVYWAGRKTSTETFVLCPIVPEAITSRGSFRTSGRANATVISHLSSLKLELVAQVHSHPGAWVDHSDGDDQDALMPYEGFLSIIVPNYGVNGMLPLSMNGVHIFGNGHFQRLSIKEIESVLIVTPEIVDLRLHQ